MALLILPALVVLGFAFESVVYWYFIDALVIVVGISRGISLPRGIGRSWVALSKLFAYVKQ